MMELTDEKPVVAKTLLRGLGGGQRDFRRAVDDGYGCRVITSIWIGVIHLLLKWSVKSKGGICSE
jgi:hypothetical protein